jgi:hypothetical protein
MGGVAYLLVTWWLLFNHGEYLLKAGEYMDKESCQRAGSEYIRLLEPDVGGPVHPMCWPVVDVMSE